MNQNDPQIGLFCFFFEFHALDYIVEEEKEEKE